jgi:hypothetical protein
VQAGGAIAAKAAAAGAIDLDLLPRQDGFGIKRDNDTALRMGADTAAEVKWGIDDVDGRLAEPALPRALPLIRLDMPWKICRQGLFMHALYRRAIGVPSALRQWADAFRRRRTVRSTVRWGCLNGTTQRGLPGRNGGHGRSGN